nr:immunoglobulin light chain junction region [Macaca mulatta]
CQQGYNSPFTF